MLDVRHAAQSREFRSQPADGVDEALVFAIKEETDLAQRVDIPLVRQLHHVRRI